MLRLTSENAEFELAGAMLKPMTSRTQDAGEHSHDERRARTALEHRDAHGQEIRQPYRITERYHQLQCDGRSQQHGGRHPDPAVTRSRTRTHAGRFQNKKGG
ncbi:hypothetical protein AR274_19660 [Stenotrophomonas maltophilia]|nr:hypothetical protein AR274_19660 [Stenotrophomonas maltophilia]